MHREYVNARRPNPFKFEKGDNVWICCQIQLNKACSIVGKMIFQKTGPLEITACSPGGSYELCHYRKHNTKEKEKASKLSPYLDTLISMTPLAECDTSYGELNEGILKSLHHEAGITDSTNSITASIPAINLLAVVIPCEKYNVAPFTSLPELN